MIELQIMHFIKKIFFYLIFIILIVLAFYFGRFYNTNSIIHTDDLNKKNLILKKYSIPNLKKSEFLGNDILIDELVKDESTYSTYLYYSFDNKRKISGLINIPKQSGNYPIAILIRGYVDKETYSSGIGTQRVGEFLVQNGFITIAPDFLGYGQSDKEAKNGLESRFQTYTTTLELLASLDNLNSTFVENDIDITANTNKVVIWGHSNGGHVALTTLAITGKNYPTVLWAPVSKPFPYSILFYTDEYLDRGKYLRKLLAEFEQDYDVEKYNPANYYQWIKAPIQIHQGTIDKDVPIDWSDELYNQLKKLKKDVEYFNYEGADHNLMPNGWSPAVNELVSFYLKNI